MFGKQAAHDRFDDHAQTRWECSDAVAPSMLTFRAKIRMFWWRRRSRKREFLHRLRLAGKSEATSNFGDELGPLLVSCLSGRDVRHSRGPGKLLTVGSIFFALRKDDTVWGSGLIHEADVKHAKEAKRFEVLAVRGPKSRDALLRSGFDCPSVFGDPALLLPHVFEISGAERQGVGVVPHWTQLARFRDNLSRFPAGAPVNVIDVTSGCLQVVKDIASCRYVVSSSLHGVIVADALGIPALPVVYEKQLHDDPFKFEDYMGSTDREYRPCALTLPLNVDRLVSLAECMPKPRIDLLPLLQAFPCRKFSSFEGIQRRSLEHCLASEESVGASAHDR